MQIWFLCIHVDVDVDVFNVHINLPIISLKNFPGCWIVARQQEKSGSPVLQGLQKWHNWEFHTCIYKGTKYSYQDSNCEYVS